jgi:hypothetical protein
MTGQEIAYPHTPRFLRHAASCGRVVAAYGNFDTLIPDGELTFGLQRVSGGVHYAERLPNVVIGISKIVLQNGDKLIEGEVQKSPSPSMKLHDKVIALAAPDCPTLVTNMSDPEALSYALQTFRRSYQKRLAY